ncbi:DUF2163 domain-containing protein [Enterovirga sp. CN4-39]|uniref:DUF2163 domain-containing protein n=1 Tax=Enterovirga sp. CN4-39 TaxID=3400910 RepID=UPI003C072C34
MSPIPIASPAVEPVTLAEVAGALVSTGLTETDILAGRYDDASVETWIANWTEPEARLLTDVFSIGEIRRADGAFVAELRGPMHRLDEERGLTYRATCSADLGDGRCRVDLSSPIFMAEAAVETADGAQSLTTGGLDGYAAGWFTGGRLLWLTGANAGVAAEVQAHRILGDRAELDLWRRMPAMIEPGDTFRVSAGCDKRLQTCRGKFDNVLNHRGFPHMPGNDFVLKVAASGTGVFDGGSLFR